jgi:hypothetical protein
MTVVGDKFVLEAHSLANNGTLAVQPASGYEATIHNIMYNQAVQFFANSPTTTSFMYDSDGTAGARLGLVQDVNNTYYITVKNVSGSAAAEIVVTGVYTKTP